MDERSSKPKYGRAARARENKTGKRGRGRLDEAAIKAERQNALDGPALGAGYKHF
jgi:hypothetical protein